MKASASIWYGTAIAIFAAAVLLTWLTGELVYLFAVLGICAVGLALRRTPGAEPPHPAGREARLIVESMPGLGWSADAKGKFRYLSPSIFAYTGRRCPASDRVDGTGDLPWKEVLHPEDVDRVVETWLHSLETGEPYEAEHRIRRFDGVYRWFRAAARPSRDENGRITGWYGLTLDIDDRRKVEEALRTSERELKSIVESIPGMIAAADAQGRHAYANGRLLDYIGIEFSDAVDHPWIDVVHPEDREAVLKERRRIMKTGEPLDVVYRRRRSDGVYRWFRVWVEPARDEHGKIVRWYSLLVDVHEQKMAQEALHKSEQQLRLLIDTMPALVWCATPTGEPFYLSKRLLDYSGLSSEEAGQARSKLIHPDDIPALLRAWKHSVESGRSFTTTYRLRRADGAYRWFEGRAEPWRDAAGAVIQWYGVNVDIDERLRAEQALRLAQSRFQRASQLASLAELSASIAHEVNQPLAAVITNSHACQRWLSAEPPNVQRALLTAQRIIRDANGAAEVVSRIRALFKRTALSRAPVDMNEVVVEVCQVLTDDIATSKVSVETVLEDDLPRTLADRVQMQQVLVNLIRNGIDAMEAAPNGPKALTIRSRRDGTDMISIEIADHGIGVDDPERIFEPFFTTKTDGMGMGLAICRSIVEAHDGRLWAARGEPAGTTFTFALPVLSDDPA